MNPDINRLRRDLGLDRSPPPAEEIDVEVVDEDFDAAPPTSDGVSLASVIGYGFLILFIIVADWFILPVLFSFLILLLEFVVAVLKLVIVVGIFALLGYFILFLIGLGNSRS